MSLLSKSIASAVAVSGIGALLWVGLTDVLSSSASSPTPVPWILGGAFYVLIFAGLGLYSHDRIVGRYPIVLKNGRRRPSFMISVVLTIVLMIFMVSYATSQPDVWALG